MKPSEARTVEAELRADRRLDDRQAARVPQPVERDGRRHCPRDGSRLTSEPYLDGIEWSCWQCGYRWYDGDRRWHRAEGALELAEPEGAGPMTNSHHTQQQPAGPAMPEKRWDQLAQERLAALLTRINAVTELHREAEAIHRALTAYGVGDLPALPWLGPQVKRTYGERTCPRCGSAFMARYQGAKFCGASCASSAKWAAWREREAWAACSDTTGSANLSAPALS